MVFYGVDVVRGIGGGGRAFNKQRLRSGFIGEGFQG